MGVPWTGLGRHSVGVGVTMPASFWFEERGTETYYRHVMQTERHYYKTDPEKSAKSLKMVILRDEDGKAYWETETVDWNKTEPRTREEYEAERASGEYVHNRTWQKRKKTDLQRVDELICEFMGDPAPDPKRDSEWYHACHEWGFWTLYSLGGSYIGHQDERVKGDHMTRIHEQLDGYIGRVRESDPEYAKKFTEGYTARAHAMLDWVFTKKWEFHACG